jgi:site-specific DNA-methyltransferase (adenine-specific)
MPLQIEEDIVCFCKGNKKVNYYPQMRKGKMRSKGGAKTAIKTMGEIKSGYKVENDLYFPVNILEFANCRNRKDNVHPTQKPTDLLEYLIRTYTNEGETVLDFTMGSGSTGVSCVNTGRKFIGIELDEGYFNIAKKRIEEASERVAVTI